MSSTLRQRIPVQQSQGPASDSGNSSDEELVTYGQFPTFTPPNLTIKEILNAIPAHCFERSALRSSAYVVGDFAMIAALMYAASFIEPALGFKGEVVDGVQGAVAKWAAWSLYWVFAGFVYTGVWICGGFFSFHYLCYSAGGLGGNTARKEDATCPLPQTFANRTTAWR